MKDMFIEDGRRTWHTDSKSPYSIPNDSPEHFRLNEQHTALLALMNNQPIHAAIDEANLTKIVDIGCGTGAMTLFLAQRFPNANVYGIDLSAVPDAARAEAGRLGNVTFLRGNLLDLIGDHPDLQLGSFDLAYSRMLVAGMKSWPEYVEKVTTLLKPGGWIEMHEHGSLKWYDGNDNLISNDWYWTKEFRREYRSQGVERRSVEVALPQAFHSKDLSTVSTKTYKLPFGPAPDRAEAALYAKYSVTEFPKAFVGCFARFYAGEQDSQKYDCAVRDIWNTLGAGEEGRWSPLMVICAQRRNDEAAV